MYIHYHSITLSDRLVCFSLKSRLQQRDIQGPKKEEQQEEDVYVWNQRFPREPNMMMEGIKGLGGERRVCVGEEDIGDSMQCNDHAFRNNPGGICPFCLQEKLGKLVSSFSLPIRSSSSSSPSPSFKSDIGNGGAGSSSSSPSLSVRPTLTKVIYDAGSKDGHYLEYYRRRARILFLLAKKKIKKKKKVTTVASSDRAANMVFKRSKYTATPGRKQFSGADNGEHVSQRKSGGFWSFLYSSSSSSSTTTTASSSSTSGASKSMDKSFRDGSKITTLKADEATNGSVGKHKKKKRPGSSLGEKSDIAEDDDDDDDDDGSNRQATASASSFERKVWRSRFVGCGSRSFSGDLFERISAEFGDCTLRRVESQRAGKSKVSASAEIRSSSSSGHQQKCMKERVKCGGIFAGFMRI